MSQCQIFHLLKAVSIGLKNQRNALQCTVSRSDMHLGRESSLQVAECYLLAGSNTKLGDKGIGYGWNRDSTLNLPQGQMLHCRCSEERFCQRRDGM